MFYGEYQHTVDEKGRLIIPARFRSSLRETYIDRFYLTRGLEKCIFVFTEHEWSLLEQKFRSLPITHGKSRAFSRMLFSGAYEAVCDKQGRINIPANLIEYASIMKDVIVVGVLNRFEIWDRKAWNSFVEASTDSFEEIAENLVDLGETQT